MTTTDYTVSPCPCCGGFTLTSEGELSALLAVCDVLTIWALESLGKRIVRADRHRFERMRTRPWHVAHTLWAPDDAMVSKALQRAWDVVPALLSAQGQCAIPPRLVTDALDGYVHDLAITATPHTLPLLAARLQQVGLPVYLQERAPCYA